MNARQKRMEGQNEDEPDVIPLTQDAPRKPLWKKILELWVECLAVAIILEIVFWFLFYEAAKLSGWWPWP